MYFLPADMITQVLNFGLPAPIDIQIMGPIQENDKNYQVAQQLSAELKGVPGAVDVHVQQILDSPTLMINTDRSVAMQSGLSESVIANSLSVSLSGSGTATTNFWLNYKNGVNYPVIVQVPQERVSSMDALHRTPISLTGTSQTQLLWNLASVGRMSAPLSLNHFNVRMAGSHISVTLTDAAVPIIDVDDPSALWASGYVQLDASRFARYDSITLKRDA